MCRPHQKPSRRRWALLLLRRAAKRREVAGAVSGNGFGLGTSSYPRRRRLAVIGLAQLSSASAPVVGQSLSAPKTSTWSRMRLRHASPRLVACICRDAGALTESIGGGE